MKAHTDTLHPEEARAMGITLDLRREDLLFPHLSGNKYRKLKYNLEQARTQGFTRLLTFGGAYSNHIHAVAAAGAEWGMEAVGLIRGEELQDKPLNPTLADAARMGMQLHFLSRSDYGRRHDPEFQHACQSAYGPAYVLPEGGTNPLAVRGCAEILDATDARYHVVCCPVGTGGTLAGLSAGATKGQQVRGYCSLVDPEQERTLKRLTNRENWTLVQDYTFGGYARVTEPLIHFMNAWHRQWGIPLDPVYTGKMVYGVLEDIRAGRIPKGSNVLMIHTGGLQGVRGMNLELAKKNLPLLEL